MGYEAGARHVNASIHAQVEFVDSWSNASAVMELASAQFQAGADVIYHAAGSAGFGVLPAAADATASTGVKRWTIGPDTDGYLSLPDPAYRDYVLTSAVKRVDL